MKTTVKNSKLTNYLQNTQKITRRKPLIDSGLTQSAFIQAENDQLAINSENYLRKQSHINMVRFAYSYIPTNLTGRRNVFSMPSTTYSLPRVLEKHTDSSIKNYYTFVEMQQGEIFAACKLMSYAYNTVDLINNTVKGALPQLPHEYFHFMFLDYMDTFSSIAEELHVILMENFLKVGGVISLTTNYRDDQMLLDFWRTSSEYREPIKGETQTNLALTYFLTTSYGKRYEVIDQKNFDRMTNTIIKRID